MADGWRGIQSSKATGRTTTRINVDSFPFFCSRSVCTSVLLRKAACALRPGRLSFVFSSRFAGVFFCWVIQVRMKVSTAPATGESQLTHSWSRGAEPATFTGRSSPKTRSITACCGTLTAMPKKADGCRQGDRAEGCAALGVGWPQAGTHDRCWHRSFLGASAERMTTAKQSTATTRSESDFVGW